MKKPLKKIFAHRGQQFLTDNTGKPFTYLADTWWYGLTDRWTEKEFQQAVQLRKKQGFTVLQVVVGVPPEIPFWSDQAKSGGEHPFLSNFSPNPDYFHLIEKRIQYIVDQGIVPCIFGGWGYQIDQVGGDHMKLFWEEIIKRYQDLPVIYCLTGEVDLFPPLGYFHQGYIRNILQRIATHPLWKTVKAIHSLKHKDKLHHRIEAWSRVAKHIKSLDPFTPLTVHIHQRTTASQLFEHPKWLDIDSLQSGHADQANTFFLQKVKNSKLHKPFLDLESPYEGILDQFYGEVQHKQLQIRLNAGAAGYVYGAQGLWNLNSKADPFLTHWGKQTWNEAVKFRDNSPLNYAFKT